MKTLIVTILILGLCLMAQAGQKYNMFENRWETVPDYWQPKYNMFEDSWSYQPKDAEIEYNIFEDEYEWDSGHRE